MSKIWLSKYPRQSFEEVDNIFQGISLCDWSDNCFYRRYAAACPMLNLKERWCKTVTVCSCIKMANLRVDISRLPSFLLIWCINLTFRRPHSKLLIRIHPFISCIFPLLRRYSHSHVRDSTISIFASPQSTFLHFFLLVLVKCVSYR